MSGHRIVLITGDITQLEVDAVVNAANRSLLGGGGVDGAIHRAAGPELLAACRKLGGCETGQVRLTPGFNLPARYVIHAVGPVWRGGGAGEAERLASCYRNALMLAEEQSLNSLAFPAISCGVYGYPVDQAARIAVCSVIAHLRDHTLPRRIYLCAFSGRIAEALEEALCESGAGYDTA